MGHQGDQQKPQPDRNPKSIHGGDTEPDEDTRAEENFDDETQNPDLAPGAYPSDPDTGDATTPPPDEARKDADKPR